MKKRKMYCVSLWIHVIFVFTIGMLVYNSSVYAENEEAWMPDPALREAV